MPKTVATSPEAEALVRDVLKASGSSLDFFSLEKTRREMLEAADKHLNAAFSAGVNSYVKVQNEGI
jgi:hypothetical protein